MSQISIFSGDFDMRPQQTIRILGSTFGDSSVAVSEWNTLPTHEDSYFNDGFAVGSTSEYISCQMEDALFMDFGHVNPCEKVSELNSLVTFQRVSSTGEVYETTLNAKASGQREDTMANLIRRLQQRGDQSGVLMFEANDVEAIQRGAKQIVFSLVQVSKAAIGKEEFGCLKASYVLHLTQERPILVEIQVVDSVHGAILKLF